MFNYSDGNCHYISLTKQVAGCKREKITNYAVCNGSIKPLGEEQDYFFGVPEDVRSQAKQIAKTCSIFGSSSYNFRNFRIDCRVLNPYTPCIVEIVITRAGRLIEKHATDACRK